ncbi:hypothetical protein SZ64_00635 [Erythrobacter sp. SG61-1L]|uniref:DUF3489 domain-containing protein n=1 Tax=Erythrobacter sp. SG61-1L TaxID=1603897 RepID=UPI0006D6DAE9|nr:DUF3489 domain-containing protein [Erythrobacter sp. SG61-1L]KPL66738.1 hypothetical protein SZ64_00635 [Erythrobacter sp. SG61-1L]
MTKTENTAAAKPRTARTAGTAAKTTRAAATPKAKALSKGDTLVAMLSKPAGATIAAMMEATGWQQHSVRGFLAGTVRKKLSHELVSQKEDAGRVYRIIAGKAAS